MAGAIAGACDGEDAPKPLINTHLAFGDAQSVAMLDPVTFAYKHLRPLHRTEMSYSVLPKRTILYQGSSKRGQPLVT